MWSLVLKVSLVLGVTLTSTVVSRKVEWTDDDTIIVEATREEDAPNAVFERNDIPFFYYAPPIPSLQKRRGHGKGQRVKRSDPGKGYIHTCYTVLGDQGYCTTFTECFPMLYYTEGDHKGEIKHPVLADLLMSTSGPCQPPPLSFRDDFVPYEGSEEEGSQQPLTTLDFVNRRDLICCPSTKATPIPPSGEHSKYPTVPTMLPVIERVQMRTTPSTTTNKPVLQDSETDEPEVVSTAQKQDAVAGFIAASYQFPTGDAAPPPPRIPTTSKPNPSVGQWGHRIPTRSTTALPKLPDNNLAEAVSENDESEEKEVNEIITAFIKSTKTPPTMPTSRPPAYVKTNRPKLPVKGQSTDVSSDISVKGQSGDAFAPMVIRKPVDKSPASTVHQKLTFPQPSGSVPPSTEKAPDVDASVPIPGVVSASVSRPSTKPRRPIQPIQNQDPTIGDVYVPVISVGSMTPDDQIIMPMPPPTTTTTTTAPSTVKFSSLQKSTPKPTPPDAAPAFPFQATKVQLVTGTSGPSAIAPPQQIEHSDASGQFSNLTESASNAAVAPEIDANPLQPDAGGAQITFAPEIAESSVPEITTVSTTTTTKFPPIVKAPCGRLNSTSDPKYPWVAAIKLGPKFICAGSVIDEYHILTSAACVAHLSSTDIGKLRVYLGERILNSNMDGPTIIRKVLRTMRHRGFSVTTLRHDIALLKLSLPIPIGTKRVVPVCLPLEDDSDLMLESSAEIVGWSSNWNQVQNEVTQESRLAIWSKDACIDKYRFFIPDTHFDDEDMICAQTRTDTTNSPKSLANPVPQEVETDGSPLIVKGQTGIYQQIGISSWKLGSISNFPLVLTRVSAYRHWIEKNRLRP